MSFTNLTKDAGVKKQILKTGSGGSPPVGAKVCVHYRGTFPDGKQFDANKNFKFNLGQSQVIKGWDIGVESMIKGEKCLLICAPNYAYGADGAGAVIPPNATLHFEVELISW